MKKHNGGCIRNVEFFSLWFVFGRATRADRQIEVKRLLNQQGWRFFI
jgi:hypothetical protein